AVVVELVGAGLQVVVLRMGSGDAIPAELDAALHAQGILSVRVPGLPLR
ncbi:siroheme synthase, partial [Xanthomonas perforans]|nr:siroheme synthase [Xanthomonas perforans]